VREHYYIVFLGDKDISSIFCYFLLEKKMDLNNLLLLLVTKLLRRFEM
jgi:hypothetical protein